MILSSACLLLGAIINFYLYTQRHRMKTGLEPKDQETITDQIVQINQGKFTINQTLEGYTV
jgi:hypothetical protein